MEVIFLEGNDKKVWVKNERLKSAIGHKLKCPNKGHFS